ncbi:hypothetical protein PybrP1_007103 [[Pythium] brassicae (nom. inval.)]|nr:hypothetical protein PybrP1_007103 [[Pythium] brassicae (nom. inval.)]
MAPTTWTTALASAALLLTGADAHSALLANGKLLGQLNSGECFNCAIGSFPKPADIPASAVDSSSAEDGIAAYAKSSGRTVKDLWLDFQKGTPSGSISDPDAIRNPKAPDTCGRYNAKPPVDAVPAGSKITFKKSNHNGPAEVWIDGVKKWGVDNFVRDGKAAMSADIFKCNKATCEGRWYWLGKVRVKGKWDHYQLYVQCFTIKNNSGGGGGAADADADNDTPVKSGNSTTSAKTSKPKKDAKTPKSTKAAKASKKSKPAEDEE